MRIFFPLVALFAGLSGRSVAADFTSMTDFVSGLDGVSYECSFLSNPRMKFFADRIENLDLKGKTTGTLKNFSYLEPGLGKIEYTSGASAWIAFSDDLSAFAIANMEKVYDCTGTEAGATFSETNAPTTLTISGHPTIAKIAVEANTITLYSADGTKIGERQAFRFLPHAIGFIDENFKDGFLLLSREKPGGWWMEGNHLGTEFTCGSFADVFPLDLKIGTGFFPFEVSHLFLLLIGMGCDHPDHQQSQPDANQSIH